MPWLPDEGKRAVVSDDLRRDLDESNFPGLRLNTVTYKRVVRLEWEEWDLHADEPKVYPPVGEPEGYVTDLPHDRRTAAAMAPAWELVPPVVPLRVERREDADGCFLDEYEADRHQGDPLPLFLSRETHGWFVVTDVGRAWFETHAGEWVWFSPVNHAGC
jgi:hypothetical protein